MTTLLAQPVFRLYALSSAMLVVIMYGIGFWTAKVRADRKVVVNPEDVKVNNGAQVGEVEHPDVARIKRTHSNAVENMVPFFVIAFAYSQTMPSLTMARVLFFSFVALRFLHVLFYVSAKQPFRTAMFAFAAVINLIMVVQVIRAVV